MAYTTVRTKILFSEIYSNRPPLEFEQLHCNERGPSLDF